jgi:hypothetical protein
VTAQETEPWSRRSPENDHSLPHRVAIPAAVSTGSTDGTYPSDANLLPRRNDVARPPEANRHAAIRLWSIVVVVLILATAAIAGAGIASSRSKRASAEPTTTTSTPPTVSPPNQAKAALNGLGAFMGIQGALNKTLDRTAQDADAHKRPAPSELEQDARTYNVAADRLMGIAFPSSAFSTVDRLNRSWAAYARAMNAMTTAISSHPHQPVPNDVKATLEQRHKELLAASHALEDELKVLARS